MQTAVNTRLYQNTHQSGEIDFMKMVLNNESWQHENNDCRDDNPIYSSEIVHTYKKVKGFDCSEKLFQQRNSTFHSIPVDDDDMEMIGKKGTERCKAKVLGEKTHRKTMKRVKACIFVKLNQSICQRKISSVYRILNQVSVMNIPKIISIVAQVTKMSLNCGKENKIIVWMVVKLILEINVISQLIEKSRRMPSNLLG